MSTSLFKMLLIAATSFAMGSTPERVLRIDLSNEAITPVTEQFITGAIQTAGEQGMHAVILVLIACAVKENPSVSANGPLKEDIVDLVGDDFSDLLPKLQGRELSTAANPVTLRTANAPVVSLQMWWRQRFLQTLSDIGGKNNTTIVFPRPIDLFEMFGSAGRKRPPQPPEPESAKAPVGA